MIKYVLKQNKNKKSNAYGKFYAHPVIEETVGLEELADHMALHNTPFSKGVILGLLTDMVDCIKELLLEGKNVKMPDLAIFSLGIKNAEGAEKEEEFSVTKNIQGVKLRARATGELTRKALDLVASVKKATALVGAKQSDGQGSDDTTIENP
ncbi:MAG: DNA-binding protein [Prevotella sp.]|nr:DNA-binding protein [Prevotella sp.]